MPHIVIEYSSGADERVDMAALVQSVHNSARESGLFARNAVRTLARGADYSCVANGAAGNHYIQITMRIAPGRNAEIKKTISRFIFDAAYAVIDQKLLLGPVALRVDLIESDPAFSNQINNLPTD